MEGLSIFRANAEPLLAGKSCGERQLRETAGCRVVALARSRELLLNPDPQMPLEEEDEFILIGTVDAEKQFMAEYGEDRRLGAWLPSGRNAFPWNFLGGSSTLSRLPSLART